METFIVDNIVFMTGTLQCRQKRVEESQAVAGKIG